MTEKNIKRVAPYKYNGVEYDEINLFERNRKKPVNVWEPRDKRVDFPSWSVLASVMHKKDVSQYILEDNEGRKYINVSFVDSASVLAEEDDVKSKFYLLFPRERKKAEWLSVGDRITFVKGSTLTVSILECKFVARRKVGWVKIGAYK